VAFLNRHGLARESRIERIERSTGVVQIERGIFHCERRSIEGRPAHTSIIRPEITWKQAIEGDGNADLLWPGTCLSPSR
jgi:hypothetical protein